MTEAASTERTSSDEGADRPGDSRLIVGGRGSGTGSHPPIPEGARLFMVYRDPLDNRIVERPVETGVEDASAR